MGARRIRRERIQVDQAESRRRNGVLKVEERDRRDARMIEAVKKGQLPYAPHIMSWLSAKIDKPSVRITAQDVQGLLT